MPKHDAFSPKAIANRQKSVGLQRLRWYCQMCEKQCRDENGFKCHAMSEGHLRQMRIFAENPHRLLDEFSREFEKTFLQILSHRHGTKRVAANRIYQELIADKQHVHMNSTVWTTLTGFCLHLGKEGKAIVDETEKGWFIQYIERDPEVLARQAEAEARRQQELDEEERRKKLMEEEIAAAEERLRIRERDRELAAASAAINNPSTVSGTSTTTTSKTNTIANFSFSMNNNGKGLLNQKKRKVAAFEDDDDDGNETAKDDEGIRRLKEQEAALAAKRAKSSMERMMQQEIQVKNSTSSSSVKKSFSLK
jgi:DNA/RNA-binding protein KIN17